LIRAGVFTPALATLSEERVAMYRGLGMSAKARLLAVALLLTLSALLLVTACSDSDDNGGSPTQAQGQVLSVTLNEYSITDEEGGPLPAADAGTIDFVATNEGILAHDLIVISTDVPADQLPLDGSAVDVGALDVTASVQAIPSGQTDTLVSELETGDYVLICNVSGHYELGMYTSITVQ
jgi:uncharacterized cupredoxin-like copper-binding protein